MFVRRLLLAVVALAVFCGSLAVAQAGAPASPTPAAAPTSLPTKVPGPEPTSSSAPPSPGSPSPSPIASAAPFAFPSGLFAGFPGVTGAPAQNYATFVRGATRQSGAIDLIRKDDDLYLDLSPDNLDKTFIIAPSIASGVGSGAFAGRVYDPFLVRFKRVGKRILWISPNTRYVAQKGSAEAASLAVSVADSVLLSSPIVAEDPEKKHLVIAPSLFLTDFEGIGADLGRGSQPAGLPGLLVLFARPSFGVDSSKSYYLTTKAFPRNDEVSVNLTFNGPANAVPTVPDGRGIPIGVHYSIVVPPAIDKNFMPRYADDRVGYFITARKRYDNDALSTPFERFINRWNLDNGPITFYLSNEIPKEYRGTVRRGVLAWNDAFAKIGHPNAIVVKDQPSDPAWDPDDARYTVVRWITSDRPEFSAYSPSVVDPSTGQIIRATVVIDGESLRTIKRGYVDSVLPARRDHSALAMLAREPDDLPYFCEDESGSLAQAAIGMQMLAANPKMTANDRETYAQSWLYATVMHEVGHTLGLRHNFQGSTAYSLAQLHDPDFTRAHGTTASVMDYTPVNLAGPGKRQGAYFTDRLGVYDEWAIRYGYTDFANTHSSAEELPYLAKIAARSTQPGYAYGTDEDAIDGIAVDPRIARFDLSRDPLGFDAEQLALNEALAKRIEHPYRGDTRSYEDLRQQLVTVLNNELEATLGAAHYVGGIYTSRSHRGQPGGEPPLQSIPRAEQQRAFNLVGRYVLSSQALVYSPQLLNDLTTSRYGIHWNASGVRRADFPLREVVAEIQDDAIATMFAAPNLSRIADQQLKMRRPDETMTLADLFAWTNGAIFDDFGNAAIAPTHRDLQRRFADLEMQIAVLPSFVLDQLGMPREIQALSRYSLQRLDGRLDRAVALARDPGTHAHLDDLRARIRGVLDAKVVRPL